ncbi:MAG: hypothetical protein WAN10_12575 [Candidatus Acidiferrales bacterium]
MARQAPGLFQQLLGFYLIASPDQHLYSSFDRSHQRSLSAAVIRYDYRLNAASLKHPSRKFCLGPEGVHVRNNQIL